MKKVWALLFVVIFLSLFDSVDAKSYFYESINADISINTDTTFTVRETQTFVFDGVFNEAWRSIPKKKFDKIKNITVYDGKTGKPYIFSPKTLEYKDPSSFGKYTYKKREGGGIDIIWYFNAENEKREWIIEYTVVGGLSFLKEKNELYWNILTEYTVPVQYSFVEIKLPSKASSQNELQIFEYLEGGKESFSYIVDSQKVYAGAMDMRPRANFTVAFGFPLGLIERGEYWKEFFIMYWGYILGIIILFLSIVGAFLYWYFTEKHNKGKGTIIVEYEPPSNLPPALGEVIVKERITKKTFPATLIDLAVRGYIKIEEEKNSSFFYKTQNFLHSFHNKARVIRIIFFFLFLLASVFFVFKIEEIMSVSFFFLLFVFFILFKLENHRDYIITQIKECDENVRKYEKEFLSIIFSSGGKVFSTKEMRFSTLKKTEMYKLFKKYEKTFYKEVEGLGLHTHSIHKEKMWKDFFIILVFTSIGVSFSLSLGGHLYFFFGALLFSFLLLLYMIKFEVKLTDEGHSEREKWLGFKEFLYRVERYRLQDLTPETFEKYLPYAMVFGIEKKWAKRFEGIIIQTPSWYTSHSSYGFHKTTVLGSSGGFSITGFSTSLSSSFTSSFSTSSGSSGASGGGGSAGGGGGGGGGGAR